MSLLSINNLRVTVGEKEIVCGVSLKVEEGEIHAIMGPNGSGKSSLVHALAGHPAYTMHGTVSFAGKDLKECAADERARMGLFLAFQYPREIVGVSLKSFLFAAYRAQHQRVTGKKRMSPLQFDRMLGGVLKELRMDPAFLDRSLNQGFSGGEKKKAEILQLKVLQPQLALLDETDSGLDIDALRIVADGVNTLRGPEFSAIVVTHYARLLQYVIPDYVHIMVGGRIVESGGKELAEELEKKGYGKYI
ncbi:Fe-S cluster assembly ATPase SufC [Candidatus Peregrinibacteria bacterium]|nr:Fe-S cluster assembly ATPase SufC [Candidatus Peregrinibacteria bacterium]